MQPMTKGVVSGGKYKRITEFGFTMEKERRKRWRRTRSQLNELMASWYAPCGCGLLFDDSLVTRCSRHECRTNGERRHE